MNEKAITIVVEPSVSELVIVLCILSFVLGCVARLAANTLLSLFKSLSLKRAKKNFTTRVIEGESSVYKGRGLYGPS